MTRDQSMAVIDAPDAYLEARDDFKERRSEYTYKDLEAAREALSDAMTPIVTGFPR